METLLATLQEDLKQQFGDAILAIEQDYDFPVIIVAKNQLKAVLSYLKDDEKHQYQFLTTLCGIHFPDNEQDKEFCIMYQLHNLVANKRVRIKSFMPEHDVAIPTVTDLWLTANWMERQEYDFFGFDFVGHPNLKRILNMDEMNYFPMRKQYPLEDLQRDDKNDKMFGR
ncbi:MAG: NADH-quinone oxidoreductase subunit C [Chitinophagales bacterium]|nr:NADH-quinone oxidoreductase subunit C [Chitinophagales bacterium]